MLRSIALSALLFASSPLLSSDCVVQYTQQATLESTTVGVTPFADSYGIIYMQQRIIYLYQRLTQPSQVWMLKELYTFIENPMVSGLTHR